MRKFIKIDERQFPGFWERLIHWLDEHESFAYLSSNNFKLNGYEPGYKHMAAVGEISGVTGNGKDDLGILKGFLDTTNDWVFGFFTYDIKNQTEELSSANDDEIGMPDLHFFCPALLFIEDADGIRLGYKDGIYTEQEVSTLLNIIANKEAKKDTTLVPEITSKVSKARYLENINKIKEHIQWGDVYELNYCIEHYATNAEVDPASIYSKLNRSNPAPFSCFYKVGGKYLISASPERFIKKTGCKVISQPMKGTAKRGANAEEDEQLKSQLYSSEKERAENVMIVDLVRNDLSRTAKPASVEVEELYGIYTFPQVHQMISTVKAEVGDDIHVLEVIKEAFPMGSMTGAPKVKAMELIEKYETTKRGLFSGSVGFFTPERDFDFNVIIRSILFNSDNKYLSFMTGGAITINSDPEQEYEECLLKAKALKQALS